MFIPVWYLLQFTLYRAKEDSTDTVIISYFCTLKKYYAFLGDFWPFFVINIIIQIHKHTKSIAKTILTTLTKKQNGDIYNV